MNLRTSSILMLLGFLALSLSGCEEDRKSGAAGRLSLRLSADGAVTDVTTRSGNEDIPDVKDFSMTMLQGDKVQASWDKLADYDEDTTFPVGTYTMKAFYGDMENEGFASPYYEGSTDVVIQSGATTEVEATCKLANTKITIEYTDDFKSYFKTYSSKVKSELGSEVTFASTETRAAYIKPGRVSVKVTFTKATGGSASEPIEVATIEAALPQHHYHLLMDVDAGKAMLSVIFDRVTEEKPITLDVSDKALNIKAPYFTLTGFEKTSNDNNQWDGNLTEADKLSALLTSLGGFKKCVLRTTSPNLRDSWPVEGFDLAGELTPEQQTILANSGLKLTGFGANKDQMAILDFTGVVPHLNISDANSEHLFYLQATSTYGKESEEYVLNITTPKNFMLLPTAPVTMKSTTVTIPVKLKVGNPQNIKLYYKYYGVMTLINSTTITAIADKEGYYNIEATGIDMGFVAKDFQAEYNGVKSAVVSVGVIIPNYTFSLNPENIWSYSADMTIVPENSAELLNLMSAVEPYISTDGTNWKKWENISLDVNTGKVVLKGLTPGTKYYFRTTCDDGETFTNPVMYTMETATSIPNANFTKWGGAVTYPNVKSGGRSTYYSFPSSKFRDYKYVDISYQDPVSWSSTNSLTVPLGANPQNTWYMVPSVLQYSETDHSSCVFLRNVAWNNAGEPVNDNTSTNIMGNGNEVRPPSTFNRSSGKIYLGELNNGRDVGISCMSRPAKISFNYKYVPVTSGDNSGGVVRLVLENEDGQVITQFYETISSANWVSFEKTFDYQTSLKPARLKLLFASSTNWSFDQSIENTKIKTTHETNNSDDALKISVGSGLYIENIVLTYK